MRILQVVLDNERRNDEVLLPAINSNFNVALCD